MMKRTLLLILILFLNFFGFAQIQKGFHYKIKNKYKPWKTEYRNTLLYRSDTTKGKISLPPDTIKLVPSKKVLKASIELDKETPGKLRLHIWQFNTPPKSPYTDSVKYILSTTPLGEIYLQINDRDRIGEATKYKSIPYATWEAGVTTVPVKYRFGHDTIPSHVSTGLNAGLYISRKWGRSRFFIDDERNSNSIAFSLASFLAPTPVELTAANTEIGHKVKKDDKITILAMTLGFGFQLSKDDISIGFLAGWDIPISERKYKWIYRNYPWIGFGIGYKLAMFSAAK